MLNKIKSHETLWILLDQGAVSGGNFLTALVLARMLAPERYGIFSLILLFLYAINTCHNSLIVYPLTLSAAKGEADTLARSTATSLIQTVLLGLPLALICMLFVLLTKNASLALPVFLAMLAWQMQETARRALLSSRNATKAILPDLFCYCGQGGLLLLFKPQSISAILYLIAATSTAALVWQAITLRIRLHHFRTTRQFVEDSHSAWMLGRHILGGNAFNMAALQLPSWVLAWLIGPIGVAGYQSLLNLAGVANPIIFSANTSLIPAVARSASDGVRAARKTALRLGAQYGALLLPCFVALVFFPHAAMQLVYGASTPYLGLSGLLPIFIGAFVIQYVASVVGAYEGGMSRPKTYFYVQAISTIVLAALALPLIYFEGVRGAVIAVLGFGLSRLILFVLFSIAADSKSVKQVQTVPLPINMLQVDAMPRQPSVTVCLLTYRRPELLRNTLLSLQTQSILLHASGHVDVLVVDNDCEMSAREVVFAASNESTLPIRYCSNPRNGLSTGRNIALEEAKTSGYVAFIDDDETASVQWLEELLKTAEQGTADVVTGPVYPNFINAPDWVEQGKFFGPVQRQTSADVDHVATNNTLISRKIVDNFRFNVKFDSTGGEDTDFFLRVRNAGYKMTWCGEAAVYETIPPSRANAPWILQRARSDANRYTRGYLQLHTGPKHWFIRVAKSAAGAIAGVVTLPLSIFGKHHFIRSMRYFARSAGTLDALLGRQHADYSGDGVLAKGEDRVQAKTVHVVVAGQTPPPLNGQTIMIREFVTGNYDGIAISYVPMRFSRSTSEVGRFDVRKVIVAFIVICGICRARLSSGARILYYPPAGADLIPVLRDFMILILCRPLFKKTAFHFHAAGLSDIYQRLPVLLRPLFKLAYGKPDLAIFTTRATSAGAEFLGAKQTVIVPCGIQDHWSEPFDAESLEAISNSPTILFAGILCEGKGVLTLLQACGVLKNLGRSFRVQLMGSFQLPAFQREAEELVRSLNLEDEVLFRGVLSGKEKDQAFRSASIFCFPSHYPAESFGVVLIEAMSYSLPIVATDWQGIPEVTGRDGLGSLLVPIKQPMKIAMALDRLLRSPIERDQMGAHNRKRYVDNFTVTRYRNGLETCLKELQGA